MAQLDSYKGLLFAAFDPQAPPLCQYLGEVTWYPDAFFDRREGRIEVIGGMHKWVVPCNCKFPAENFSCDRYHVPWSHLSAIRPSSRTYGELAGMHPRVSRCGVAASVIDRGSAMSATGTRPSSIGRCRRISRGCGNILKRPTRRSLAASPTGPTDNDISCRFHTVSYLFAGVGQGNGTTYLVPRGTIPLNTEVEMSKIYPLGHGDLRSGRKKPLGARLAPGKRDLIKSVAVPRLCR